MFVEKKKNGHVVSYPHQSILALIEIDYQTKCFSLLILICGVEYTWRERARERTFNVDPECFCGLMKDKLWRS